MSRAAPWFCVVMHVLALVALGVWLRGGTEAEPDLAQRAEFIAANIGAWRIGWAMWMLSAVSLVAFYAWWAKHLPASGWRIAGVLFAAAGMACDITGEGIFMSRLVEHATLSDLEGALKTQRLGSLLTAGAANAFYTIGGIVLMLRTTDLPRRVRRAMWITWGAGALMTASTLVDNTAGLVVSTAVLFPLFMGWTVWMAVRWRRA